MFAHPAPGRERGNLKEKLALTTSQAAATSESFARMTAAAKPLGEELVEKERALDSAFKAGGLAEDELDRFVEDIAAVQGRLRAAHLAAHLEMRRILTSPRVAAYDMLRGYGQRLAAPDAHHGTHPG